MKDHIFGTDQFQVFDVESLEHRMATIRQDIQPVFSYYGQMIADLLVNLMPNSKFPIHIAKHLRRTIYAPESTWVAIGGDKRGYKKYPHFQIMITKQFVFVGLACIDNPTYEKEIAKKWLDNSQEIKAKLANYAIIDDHTKENFYRITEIDPAYYLERMMNIKKAEFMLGKIFMADDPILVNQVELQNQCKLIVNELFALFEMAICFYQDNSQ